MVRNRCIDHLREQQRSREVTINKHTEFQEHHTDETIEVNDLNVHLWKAIARLPERCRVAFEYSRVDELTYTQIALKMGITPKAVEALISRSLKLLRASLVDFLGVLIFLLN